MTPDRFEKMVRALSGGRVPSMTVASGWHDILCGLYGEPHRHYHSTRHIENLLGRLDKLVPFSGPGLDRLLEAEVAIWFHDAIYVVGSKTNEEASALLARSFLFSVGATIGWDDGNRGGAFLDAVNEAILATKHTGVANGNAARVMCDLDMAGFADPWEEFQENTQRIRQEYGVYDDEAYRWGRVAFLSGLLNRRIYHVLTELEEPARANIKRAISELTRP